MRSSDGETERGRVRRDRPRLAFTPTHALGAILLLAAALSASLTMLLSQAIRYETALSAANAATRVAGDHGGAVGDDDGSGNGGVGGGQSDVATGERTSPDGAGASSSDDSAGTTSEGDGTAADGVGPTDDGGNPGVGESSANDGNRPSAEAAAPDDGRIDLNTATSDELQTINGIGPVTAGRIIDYRTQHGRFDSVDQLLDVKGIGAKTLAKIRDQVTVR
ncbi:competence protein ComEA [Bifidobacterium samirii]|uniref:Competence protein ComEA n=1 Tax=Bifidobacterium samirii TaxID=2306974 RepID=A0A430FVW0_9BIFI|nr:competence protein ComEA [Bifidobacterium samirii]